MVDFGIKGNYAGTTCQFGDLTYTHPFNSFIIRLGVKNASTSASAIGTLLNSVLDSDIYLVTNCGGHGDALRCRQVQFCVLAGSFSTADIGIHFQDGYSFADTWLGADIEVVGVCVQSDISTCSNQTFIGAQLVWTGTSCVVLNAVSNYIRFTPATRASAARLSTGADSAQFIWEDQFLGTDPSGGILIKPPAGDSTIQLDAISSQSANVDMKTASVVQWTAGMNNASPSSYQITRYSSGSAVDNPVAISSSTGIVIMVDGVEIKGSWSLFGSTPVTAAINTAGAGSLPSSAGSGAAALVDTQYDGGVGSTSYTVFDIIKALKLSGLLAS